MVHKQETMRGEQLRATLHYLANNEHLMHFLIIFLSTFMLLGALPFYPLSASFILALICGGIGYVHPEFGLILGVLFGLPSAAYQSSGLAGLYILYISLVLIEAKEKWMEVGAINIILFSAFAFPEFSIIGIFTILAIVFSNYHFGSQKTITLVVFSVLMIMTLSALWGVQNNAGFHVNIGDYTQAVSIERSKPMLEYGTFGDGFSTAISDLFNPSVLGGAYDTVIPFFSAVIQVLIDDSGFVQIIGWIIGLFVMAYLSGVLQTETKFQQTISSFAIIIPLIFYYLASILYGFDGSLVTYVGMILSIFVMLILDIFNVTITREFVIDREKSAKMFGKFGLKDMKLSSSAHSLADVGNYKDVKKELMTSIVMPLKNRTIAFAYGLKPPTGILLFGPPGTGKSLLMTAFAAQLKYKIYYVKASDLMSSWYGETEKNVTEIFNIARKNAPCILFFDEIDAIGKKRTAMGNDTTGPKVLTTMLQEMDGLKSKEDEKKPVIIIGATNIPDQLDAALMRPGRFDKIIYMSIPDIDGRKDIFKVHTKSLILAKDVDFDILAKKTKRFTGADIANVVQEAKELTAKKAEESGKILPISMGQFLRVIGSVKPSVNLANLEKYRKFKVDFERRIYGKKKKDVDKKSIITWDNVIGLKDVKKALLDAIQLPLLHEDMIEKYDITPSKGVLLYGPPGCGKTLIVKAASNELKATFLYVSGAELMAKGYGYVVEQVKNLFNRAKENTPALIFIDEIETVVPARGGSSSQVLGQFLQEMDGVKKMKGVVVIGATNRPDLLDAAILRPGRFDKIFYIGPPKEEDRAKLFKLHIEPFDKGIDFDKLADKTGGFTGADIASICQTVKMDAIKHSISSGGKPVITTSDLYNVLKNRKPSINSQLLGLYAQFKSSYGERK